MKEEGAQENLMGGLVQIRGCELGCVRRSYFSISVLRPPGNLKSQFKKACPFYVCHSCVATCTSGGVSGEYEKGRPSFCFSSQCRECNCAYVPVPRNDFPCPVRHNRSTVRLDNRAHYHHQSSIVPSSVSKWRDVPRANGRGLTHIASLMLLLPCSPASEPSAMQVESETAPTSTDPFDEPPGCLQLHKLLS